MSSWTTKTVRDTTDLIKDGTHGTHKEFMGGIPLLSAKDISKGKVTFDNNPRLISQSDFNAIHKGYKLLDGDILLTIVGSLGRVARVTDYHDDYTLQRSVAILRFKKDVDSRYMYHVMTEHGFQKALKRRESKGAQGGVYLGEIAKIKLNLPPKPEQERVVAVLETWDNYLELLDKKIALKNQLKKGLMQQLLTGKMRLPGFIETYRKFKFASLGNTYAGITGKTKDDFGTGDPYISYMNIYSNPKVNIAISDQVNIGESRQSTVQYGDLFFTTSSETPGEVGISSVLLDRVGPKVYLNSFCFGFRLDNFDILLPDFARFYLRGQEFRKKMVRIAQGASRYNLSKKYFMETEVTIPSIDEQRILSNLFEVLDNEILLLQIRKQQVAYQKKYLLKNLITGTIRTPENLKPMEASYA